MSEKKLAYDFWNTPEGIRSQKIFDMRDRIRRLEASNVELLEALDGEFDPEALGEEEIADMLEPFQAGFRRLGSASRTPRPAREQLLDMEASLKAQGIHSIEELMQVLQGEIDKNRQ